MNFNIFRQQGVRNHICEDIHREKTQIIHNKPDVDHLNAGFISCGNCGSELYIVDNLPLSISKCPYCGNSNFIPMQLKEYWLYEPLGGGGMGSVYHAFHRENVDAEFAIKILPRDRRENPFLIDSLLKEAEMGSNFGSHPHLTKVYEFGLWENEYYGVYEYVDGIRLDQIIESPIRRSDKQILLWTLQILSAEQQMFDKGYLFRDLKPQNVLIDKNGNVKLIDYGLAIPVEEAISGNTSDQIVGSPHYIPPERIVGAPESQYSEIYSLGMLVFHIISRQTYYSSEDVMKLVEKHVTSLRMDNVVGKLPAGTNPEIIRILSRMIKRDPSQRYQDYKELGSEIFQEYRRCA